MYNNYNDAMNYHQTISKNIKRLCKKQGITYSELARRAKIPIQHLQVLLYNKNRKDPRISTAHTIAKALKVKVEDLLK